MTLPDVKSKVAYEEVSLPQSAAVGCIHEVKQGAEFTLWERRVCAGSLSTTLPASSVVGPATHSTMQAAQLSLGSSASMMLAAA